MAIGDAKIRKKCHICLCLHKKKRHFFCKPKKRRIFAIGKSPTEEARTPLIVNQMEAFLLAAGLGTRLRPLTDTRPKALVEIDGTTLLELNIRHLTLAGASRIVVNVHHFADQVIDFIQSRTWDTEVLISDERQLLLDTGGGLRHAAPLFSGTEPILIHNVDILSHVPLQQMVQQHVDSMSIATLAVSERKTSRYLLFEGERLIGWENVGTGEQRWVDKPHDSYKRLAFSGIAVVEPQLLTLLPEDDHPYPIIPEYLRIANHHAISSLQHDADQWIDVGKLDTIPLAAQFLPLD